MKKKSKARQLKSQEKKGGTAETPTLDTETTRMTFDMDGEVWDIKDADFGGETLNDFSGKMYEHKGQAVTMVKKFIKLAPFLLFKKYVRGKDVDWKAFIQMAPKITNFKLAKIDSLLAFELFKECDRSNKIMEKHIQDRRKESGATDSFNCQTLHDMFKLATFFWLMLNEADSFYSSRQRDWICKAVGLHESLDMQWSHHEVTCQKCNEEMSHKAQIGEEILSFFECKKCGASIKYRKVPYLKGLARMWNLDELSNGKIFEKTLHHQTDHSKEFREYQNKHPTGSPRDYDSIPGCKECERIDKEKDVLIQELTILTKEFFGMYKKTFMENKPSEGG